MPVHPVERKLAAIFAADIAGYSRLMARDEVGTLAQLKACRLTIDELIATHRGRIFNTAGDSVVADFASAVDAVQCAVAVQAAIGAENAGRVADEPMLFRIGVHVGDVMVDGNNLLGDGVNIAARLEALAEPGAICVSAAARDHIGNKLPVGFEDLGDQQVKNIAQAIRVYRVQAGTPAAQPDAALPLPDKPSIAVLPFANMSGDPEQEYFADGVVEEITTAIARLSWLFVIARNSSFTYKGKAVDVKQVARELGVRYVLEGSVRKSGSRVRITGQLIDTATGAHIWAARFDGALDDIFELQDQVASGVAGAIEPRLRLAEIERARSKPTESLDAYDLFLRASAEMHKLTLDDTREAVRLLRRALDIDPFYLPAAAKTASCRALIGQSWPPLAEAEIAEAIQLARQVIESNKDDADALWMAGQALVLLAGELTAGAAAIDRALKQNPNSAHAWDAKGRVQCYLNQPDPAIEAFERAVRLSPLDPLGYRFTDGLALAHLCAGRYEKAMEAVDQSLDVQPRFMGAIRRKVILCGLLGRLEEARGWLERLLHASPGMTVVGFTASMAPFYSARLRAICAEGLRRAGMSDS